MDAKPHRPRARVFADENALPSAFPQKTLHSRHKSQPVLKSGLSSAAPQKFGNRRAFGDVSNIAVNKSLKNDIVLTGKPGIGVEKVVLKDLGEKGSAPSRDVQKPHPLPVVRPTTSSAVLKSNAAAKSSLSDLVDNKPGKALRKAKTTIFQEKNTTGIKHAEVEQDLAPCVEVLDDVALVPEPVEILHQELPEPVKELSQASRDTFEQFADVPVDPALGKALELDSLASDLSVIEESSQFSQLDDLEQYESALEIIPGPTIPEPFIPETSAADSIPLLLPSVVDPSQIPLPEPQQEIEEIRAPNSATIPEPEEYWDVEEDDGYVDDGYVTARSFKSIGETHVSGNVTRTLYPHVDQAVKREIAAAKDLIESTLDPAEVEDEAWDTSMVQEYGDEIFEYMRELEVRMSPNPHYMDKQTEIQWSMRSVLMDWIVQVHHRFGLLPETLFLCINLVDRFLSQKVVSLTKLQLVGATAIFVAAKYEEVDCPSVQEINFMVDNGYGVEEILKAERFMLSMLGFELGFPGPMSFLRRISKADDYDLETRTLAKYFLEVTIMDERFLTCVPSFSAAGAHCLARMMLRKGNWSPAHVYYSNYTYTQLLPLITLMLECCEDPVHHHNAVYEKYLDRRYKQAAKYVQTELGSGFRIPDQNVNVSSHLYSPVHHHFPAEIQHYPAYWPQPA